MLTLSGDVSNLCVSTNIQLSNSVKQTLIKHLNWDSANLGKYYVLARVALDPILEKLNQYNLDHCWLNSKSGIDEWFINKLYEDITTALSVAAAASVNNH